MTREVRIWLGVGLVGAAACGLGALLDLDRVLRAYLCAYTEAVGVAVGSLALWMLHNLTGGAWGRALRRAWEAASLTLPLLLVGFAPIALGMGRVFPWMHEDPEHLGAKAAYLHPTFFLVRAVVYFIVWMGLALLLSTWTKAFDRNGDAHLAERLKNLSGPGLILCGLGVTFASIDWIMSLEPEWVSTIFGAIVAAAYLLAALAFSIAVSIPQQPEAAPHASEPMVDLGNLLLAFVMVWTYLSYAQYLLIWSGNLPEEITWYLHRADGGWQWLGLGLAAGFFALPFLLLLSREVKQRPAWLRAVAWLVVVMGLLHQYWLIMPSFSPEGLDVHWLDAAAFAAIGGLWMAWFLHLKAARPAEWPRALPSEPQRVEVAHGRAR